MAELGEVQRRYTAVGKEKSQEAKQKANNTLGLNNQQNKTAIVDEEQQRQRSEWREV